MSHKKDKTSTPPRRRRGFEQAASLLSDRVQRATEGRGFAVSRLVTHWAEVVGADIAAVARPVKISYGRGGFGATLTVLTTGPMAPMVEMRLPYLRDRVNACYGYNAIQRIVLTQTAPSGFTDGQAQFNPVPPPPPAAPTPHAERASREVAARFDDPGLAEAMAQLALNHAARTDRKTRKET